MKARKAALCLAVVAAVFSGCASLVESPDCDDESVNPVYQMQHHPVSCLLFHVLDCVASNDLQGYRDYYRWAGFEAGDDFLKLRKMMILSMLPFKIRLEPPLFEISGRGEMDVRKAQAGLSCGPDLAEKNPPVREVRSILLEGGDVRGKIQLFNDGNQYRILRIDWQ